MIDHAHINPILDTFHYDFEFSEGEITILIAFVIAKAMYAQHIREGNEYQLLEELVDVKYMDKAVTLDIQQITVKGSMHYYESTKGWFICCRWKDSSTLWEKLSDLKESQPVQVAEFVIQLSFSYEPVFNQ